MSQQGERRTTNEDDWWGRLYADEPTPNTTAPRADDTLDTRFNSAPDPQRPSISDPPPWWATEPPERPQQPLPRTPDPAPAQQPTSELPPVPPEPAPQPLPPPPAPTHPPAPPATSRPRAPWEPPEAPQALATRRQSPQGEVPPGDRQPVPAPAAAPAPSAPAPKPERAPADPTQPPQIPPPGRQSDPSPSRSDVPSEGWQPPSAPESEKRRTPVEPPAAPQVPPPGGDAAPDDWQPGPAPASHRTPEGHAPWDAAAPPEAWQAADSASASLPVPPPQPARPQGEPRPGPPSPPAQPPPQRVGFVGDRPPTYEGEPTALPAADPHALGALVADTVLDGARYGTYTLRAASVRGDSARYRGEPRRDALLTARFGHGEDALILVAVAGGARAAENAHLAAADACRWIGEAVGRSHARLGDDIRAGRRGDLKSGLHRLTDRSYGKLRARASELGLEPEEYTASLRCLLLPADPACRTRVFFGLGNGGLFRLRGGAWQDIEPPAPEPAAVTGAPVVGFGSVPSETPDGDRLTMDLGITTPPSPYDAESVPPPTDPFRFRASVARPGDTLLLCSGGLADPLRGEPALAKELAERWAPAEPPGLAEYLADIRLRVKGYADDRTAVAVWEA